MANLGKHKKNLSLEWLEAEDSQVPTHSRGSHVLGSYIKIQKPVSRKFRQAVSKRTSDKPDLSMLREPGSPPKPQSRNSQLASWEHLKKLERLPRLRAPYQYKGR